MNSFCPRPVRQFVEIALQFRSGAEEQFALEVVEQAGDEPEPSGEERRGRQPRDVLLQRALYENLEDEEREELHARIFRSIKKEHELEADDTSGLVGLAVRLAAHAASASDKLFAAPLLLDTDLVDAVATGSITSRSAATEWKPPASAPVNDHGPGRKLA